MRTGLIGLAGTLTGLFTLFFVPGDIWRLNGSLMIVVSALFLVAALLDVSLQLQEIEQRAESEKTRPELWHRGAMGEVQTAALLAPLEAEGFRLLHDRRIPGHHGNIDHIVIGPSGIFVIETKSWPGAVQAGADALYHNGVSTNAVGEAQGEARTVYAATGSAHWVKALICVHEAQLEAPEVKVQKSFVVAPAHLADFIRRTGEYDLSPAEVERLAQLAEQALPPYLEPVSD